VRGQVRALQTTIALCNTQGHVLLLVHAQFN